MNELTYLGAFAAGILSFLSPCVVPLIPSYLSFITGVSFEELHSGKNQKEIRKRTMFNSLVFIAGFTLVFVSLGASSSYLGSVFQQFRDVIRIVGGILVIIFGIYLTGIIRIGFLSKQVKLHPKSKPAGYIGSFIIGMSFAAGWTPCIGPILAAILTVAAASGTALYGTKLLLVYSLGLGLPFFITSAAINTFLSHNKIIYRYMRGITIASGVLLVIFGVMLLTNSMVIFTRILPDIGIEN
jgi:cytochrome c-type biogenesis protein